MYISCTLIESAFTNIGKLKAQLINYNESCL